MTRARVFRAFHAVLAAWSVVLISWSPAARADDPSRIWHTLTSPHFYVHYYVSSRHDEAAVAQKIARAAEKAHATLVPLLRYAPSDRTHIVVTDDTDSANGSAYVVPYNAINVYVTHPESLSNLNDYDDWAYLLVLHEYVHILHLDTVSGLPWLVNHVLGKVWAPNQIQPRWFIEGLAVYYESAKTSAGRNRSALFDMILRTAVLEGKMLDLDQISSNTRYFPRGAVPYLYGGRFVAFLAERYGAESLTEISHRYGGWPVPYALNRTAAKVLGKGYVELYAEFKADLQRRYRRQQTEVRRRGETRSWRLTRHGWSVAAPRISVDGRELIYREDDGRSHPAIRVLEVGSWRERQRLLDIGSESQVISPDGRFIVYGQTVNWRTFSHYHDLYVWRRSDGQVRRLTDGLRARDPDVSPDGRQVVFVSNELGQNTLWLVPFEGGKPRVLLRGHDEQQFFKPRWSPDGREVVFSRWREGGRRDIVVLEPATGRLSLVTDDRALDMDPVFSADGRRIYFSSDRTGIFNIYCYDRDRDLLQQVTNVISGAFTPAPTPDEKTLVFVGFTSEGYDLRVMPLRRDRFLPALPYVDQRPAAIDLPDTPRSYPVRRFSPWRTIYPRSWSLQLGSDGFGRTLGAEVSATDVIGRHSYLLRTTTSLEKGYTSYLGSYSYNRLWPSLGLNTSRFVGQRGGIEINGVRSNYVEENYGLSGRVGLPVLRIPDHSISLSVGYGLNWFRDANHTHVLVEPDHLSPKLPEVGRLAGASFGISYVNIERYAWSISAERGRRLSLDLRVDDSVLGSDYESTQVSWAWTELIKLPWLAHHVLALRYAGGIARGDFKRRGYFFIGGFPEQDVLRAVVDQAPLGGAYLRGYAPGAVYGDHYQLLSTEYRMPLWNVERGLSTLPVYVNYLHLSAFADAGTAYFGDFQADAVKVGVGAELLTEWVVGYVVPLTLRCGYARGLMEGGGNRFFFLIGNPF